VSYLYGPELYVCFLVLIPFKLHEFDKLILRKIIENAATRCHILKLKCTKFILWLGLLPRPHCRSLQRSPGPVFGFCGPISKGRKDLKGVQGRGEEKRK